MPSTGQPVEANSGAGGYSFLPSTDILHAEAIQQRLRTFGDQVLHNETLNERLRTIGDQVLHNEALNGRLRTIGDQVLHNNAINERIRVIRDCVQHIWQEDVVTEAVEHFKYKLKLKEKFSLASSIGLGFSLMNVPFGIASTLSIGLVCGSSFTILWGWILFSFFTIFISLSLGEISSKFPTSGGVYHFSSILASKKYSLGV